MADKLGRVTTNSVIGNVSMSNTVTKIGNNVEDFEQTIGVATAAESYSQTDSDTCDVGLPTGHGLASGVYDAFWSESGVKKIAVGCTGTVAGDTITLDSPRSGDNFPVADPGDMVVCEQHDYGKTFDGDNLKMISIYPEYNNSNETSDCSIEFHDASHNQIKTLRVTANQPPYSWWEGKEDNPFSGNPVTHIHISNQSTENEAVFKMPFLDDITIS